jgi:hypothetical protein
LLKDAKKNALVESGRKGTEDYFEWFGNAANEPINRA